MSLSADDEAAFSTFAISRRSRLRRTAYLLCGDWHQADDLVQNALVKLYVAWHRTHHDHPDAYARRILMRCFLDERRRPWRRELPADDMPEMAGPTATPTESDARLDLRQALSKLTPRQRATVVLRFFDDASVTETAVALGCSEGTVKSQTARALARLRELMPSDVDGLDPVYEEMS